jgi:hypothetical protein
VRQHASERSTAFSIAARIASSACRCSFGRSAPVVGSFIPFIRMAVRSSRSVISRRSATFWGSITRGWEASASSRAGISPARAAVASAIAASSSVFKLDLFLSHGDIASFYGFFRRSGIGFPATKLPAAYDSHSPATYPNQTSAGIAGLKERFYFLVSGLVDRLKSLDRLFSMAARNSSGRCTSGLISTRGLCSQPSPVLTSASHPACLSQSGGWLRVPQFQ